MCGDLMMCDPVYRCLQISLAEQLGPQNLIDILRLLQVRPCPVCPLCIRKFQVLTYERALVIGPWTSDLLKFAITEVYVSAAKRLNFSCDDKPVSGAARTSRSGCPTAWPLCATSSRARSAYARPSAPRLVPCGVLRLSQDQCRHGLKHR